MNIKKILALSAGVFIIIAGLGYLFLMPDDEIGPITLEAQQMVVDNQKEEALILLLENSKELDNTGTGLMEKLQSEIYPVYVEEAQKAIDNKDYLMAYDKYQNLLRFAPQKDLPTIEKNLKDLEKIVDEIKGLENAYISYLETFERALNDSNNLLKEFKSALDKYEVGVYKSDDFRTQFTKKIDVSNDILTKLDTGLKSNNKELLSIHKDMLNLVNDQHNMLLDSLQVDDANKKNAIKKFKKIYMSIKEEQISIIQSLQEFAVKNKLKNNVISVIDNVEDLPLDAEDNTTVEPDNIELNTETNTETNNEVNEEEPITTEE